MHENGVKFMRIDSDISDTLGSKTDENDEAQKNFNKEIEDISDENKISLLILYNN